MTDLEKLLKSRGIPVRERGRNVGRNHVNICCPFCGEEKFHLGIDISKFWWKCFVCDEGGQWGKLRRKLGLPDIKVEAAPEPEKLKFDPCVIPVQPGDGYWEYLVNERQLSPDLIKAIGFGRHLKYRDYVFATAGEGNLIGRSIRSRDKIKLVERPPAIWGIEFVQEHNWERLYICEGIFDACRFPLGMAVALNGKIISEVAKEILIELKPSKFIFILDGDVKRDYYMDTALTFQALGKEVEFFNWSGHSCKDPDELYLSDPAMFPTKLGFDTEITI